MNSPDSPQHSCLVYDTWCSDDSRSGVSPGAVHPRQVHSVNNELFDTSSSSDVSLRAHSEGEFGILRVRRHARQQLVSLNHMQIDRPSERTDDISSFLSPNQISSSNSDKFDQIMITSEEDIAAPSASETRQTTGYVLRVCNPDITSETQTPRCTRSLPTPYNPRSDVPSTHRWGEVRETSEPAENPYIIEAVLEQLQNSQQQCQINWDVETRVINDNSELEILDDANSPQPTQHNMPPPYESIHRRFSIESSSESSLTSAYITEVDSEEAHHFMQGNMNSSWQSPSISLESDKKWTTESILEMQQSKRLLGACEKQMRESGAVDPFLSEKHSDDDLYMASVSSSNLSEFPPLSRQTSKNFNTPTHMHVDYSSTSTPLQMGVKRFARGTFWSPLPAPPRIPVGPSRDGEPLEPPRFFTHRSRSSTRSETFRATVYPRCRDRFTTEKKSHIRHKYSQRPLNSSHAPCETHTSIASSSRTSLCSWCSLCDAISAIGLTNHDTTKNGNPCSCTWCRSELNRLANGETSASLKIENHLCRHCKAPLCTNCGTCTMSCLRKNVCSWTSLGENMSLPSSPCSADYQRCDYAPVLTASPSQISFSIESPHSQRSTNTEESILSSKVSYPVLTISPLSPFFIDVYAYWPSEDIRNGSPASSTTEDEAIFLSLTHETRATPNLISPEQLMGLKRLIERKKGTGPLKDRFKILIDPKQEGVCVDGEYFSSSEGSYSPSEIHTPPRAEYFFEKESPGLRLSMVVSPSQSDASYGNFASDGSSLAPDVYLNNPRSEPTKRVCRRWILAEDEQNRRQMRKNLLEAIEVRCLASDGLLTRHSDLNHELTSSPTDPPTQSSSNIPNSPTAHQSASQPRKYGSVGLKTNILHREKWRRCDIERWDTLAKLEGRTRISSVPNSGEASHTFTRGKLHSAPHNLESTRVPPRTPTIESLRALVKEYDDDTKQNIQAHSKLSIW